MAEHVFFEQGGIKITSVRASFWDRRCRSQMHAELTLPPIERTLPPTVPDEFNAAFVKIKELAVDLNPNAHIGGRGGDQLCADMCLHVTSPEGNVDADSGHITGRMTGNLNKMRVVPSL